MDSLTQLPVPGVNVVYHIAGTIHGAITDLDGYFKIKPLNPGLYDLTFSSVLFTDKKINDIRVVGEKVTELDDVQMSINELGTVVIMTHRIKLIDPYDPGAVHIGRRDLKADPNKLSPLVLIAHSTPGVTASADGKQLYFRGSRPQSTMYIVDGVKTRNGVLGIPGGAIGHVTVYTGGVPAKYGDFTGGVVVIETRSYFDMINE